MVRTGVSANVVIVFIEIDLCGVLRLCESARIVNVLDDFNGLDYNGHARVPRVGPGAVSKCSSKLLTNL